jgi:hypothetical protein
MEQVTTATREAGISAELKDLIDQVIIPALVERLFDDQQVDGDTLRPAQQDIPFNGDPVQ